MKYVTLKEISNNGLFKDGDWIESKDQDKDGNVRLLQLADIGVGIFLDKSSKFINQNTFESLKCTEIKKGDILIARMPDPIGRACLFPIESSEFRYITAVDVAILRVNNDVDNRYVCYILNSPSMLSESSRQSTGATRKRISRSKLAKFKIPLPPLETQKKIAAILDEADKLRQLDQQLIEKYDELIQSLFLDMFGDPVTNPKGWEKLKFLEIFNYTTGKLDSNMADIDGKYPFFTCAKDVFRINQFAFDQEALLLAGNNAAGIYDVKYYKGKFNAYQRTYVLTLINKKSTYPFFRFHLESKLKQLQNVSIGSGTKYLTLKILSRLEFINPPIELQNQFAERVEAIEAQKALAQQSLEKSEELFNSLLQKAFKGELV
ncbi:restriction endonuclease subunit S [Weeksellaceae bacterium KMM 9724]|uniref:restriction endonuclease subunit S n=1 Tax=Profundicola chukchiensis TaxID=2961959 RepID=UPI00243EC843|nr:restriction endonuclease subunit S [Profundicola chukchiensis]MDG4950784.1 restriction endonuclease subunit S [Profundicola chukchiensis]